MKNESNFKIIPCVCFFFHFAIQYKFNIMRDSDFKKKKKKNNVTVLACVIYHDNPESKMIEIFYTSFENRAFAIKHSVTSTIFQKHIEVYLL